MPVTFTDISRVATNWYEYFWTGTGPYNLRNDDGRELYPLDGILPTTETSIRIRATADPLEPPIIEVTDTDSETDADFQLVKYPPYGILQWRGTTEALRYRVEEDVSGTWTRRANILEEGKGYYRFETAKLDDVTDHSWRVVPEDAAGNTGRAIEFDFFLVRNPDPPSVTITYDEGTGDWTVAAR